MTDNGSLPSPIEDDIDAALNNLQTTLEGSSISTFSNDITQVPELRDQLRFFKYDDLQFYCAQFYNVCVSGQRGSR